MPLLALPNNRLSHCSIPIQHGRVIYGFERQIDDLLEETTKDRQANPLSQPGEGRGVRQGLIGAIAQVPANTEPICGKHQQLAFGANTLEDHHEVELEEDDWIDGRDGRDWDSRHGPTTGHRTSRGAHRDSGRSDRAGRGHRARRSSGNQLAGFDRTEHGRDSAVVETHPRHLESPA